MNEKMREEQMILVRRAVEGDVRAMETLIDGVRDAVFNLALRMLGSFPDAEDAAQEILLKVVSRLSSFRGESAFSTWVFSIAANHLKNYRKHMFAQHPLNFDFYAADIENPRSMEVPDQTQGVDRALLSEELKLSCTNVMLQCLDADSRLAFILGAMFHLDSRVAGEVLNIRPDAYRQRFSRARKRMAEFLGAYCGEYGGGSCRCRNRVNYAVQNHRIDPRDLRFADAKPAQLQLDVKRAMEEIDDLSQRFDFLRTYASPDCLKAFIQNLLESAPVQTVQTAESEGEA